MASCGKCGTDNRETVKFCKSCGTSLAASVANQGACISCAAPLQVGAKFCKKCGATVAPASLSGPDFPASSESSQLRGAPSPKSATAPNGSANDAVSVAARFQDTAKAPLQHNFNPQASTDVRGSKWVPKSLRLIMTVCMAVLLVLASGGGFLWWNGKKHAGTEMGESGSPVKDGIATAPVPAYASPPPAPQQDTGSAGVLQAPPVSATPVQAQQATPVAEPAQVVPAAPSRKEIRVSATTLAAETKPAPAIAHSAAPAMPATVPDAMARKVTTLLAKADGYIGSHQYDKAIATAESALELEPGSTAAAAMVNKAKARQLEALKNGSSLD